MALRLSALAGGGVTIGQAVFLEDTQPSDLTIYGRRYLQSGNVETDTSLFDESIFTLTAGVSSNAETSGFANTIEDFAHDGSQYVAVGRTAQISTSPDGVAWTIQASHTFVTTIKGVAYGNSIFVAVGWNGVINSSPDGITWTNRTNGFGGSTIEAVAFLNGFFVAVGGAGGGKIATSPDGITWTQRTPDSVGSNDFKSVAYGNSTYVAVGDGGLVNTSPDLATWTLRSSINTNGILGVAYGNGLFVAVGLNDEVQTSSDGITWTASGAALGGSADIRAIDFAMGYFMATGEFNRSASSLDGSVWSLDTVPVVSSTMYGIGNDGVDQFVTGGESGKLTSIEFKSFAGSRMAHAENGENQYVRIS